MMEGNGETDVLLPMQFFPPFRSGALERERLLMLAVLQDAVECYQRYANARSARAREEFEEASRWLSSTDRNWLFSFESICDALEIDAECLRHGLEAWYERRHAAPGRAGEAPPVETGVRHIAPRRRGGHRSGARRRARGQRIGWASNRASSG
jgi:hypothetical protein